jgi:prolyl-tRNA synthetase
MHRWSKLFIPTLREAPADAEVASHKFLLRAGYIRQVGAGIYSYLLLGQRSMNKIQAIVRQEMDRIGQEFLLPALHPRELWEESGRWTVMGQNLFKLQDRKGAWLALGMTEEEVMTDIARKELRSYKQLPQIWYQIQTKFRDEPRPRAGLLRVRQFLMKDSYSFDLDEAGLDVSYNKHDAAYRAIFTRSGLNFVAVQADSGSMGGSQSQEFMVFAEAGEDLIARCPACNYAANVEKATSRIPVAEDLLPTGDGTPERVHTPGQAAIVDICSFLKILPAQDVKCVAYMVLRGSGPGKEAWEPVAVFLRGDHSVNETKLLSTVSGREVRTMNAEELEKYLHGPAGYLGPVGLKPKKVTNSGPDLSAFTDGEVVVVMDLGLEGRTNLVCGANELDYHFRNVTPGRDFQPTITADIRSVNEGEGCPVCGVPLKLGKAVEIGHIFKLGYRYSKSMGATVLNQDGKEVMPIMGCYGIGIERILTAAVEQNHDANGFWLARSIAPFDVVVTVTNVGDANLVATAEQVALGLEGAGLDVLLDDRDERAGVKFKDADLVGIPFRINIGKKVAEGRVELVTRSTSSSQDVAIAEIVPRLQEIADSV